MDRRQQKTRRAIFDAFASLLAERDFAKITVQQIIDEANVGRTTFYDHFETKEELMHQLCQSLFSHVFEAAQDVRHAHGEQQDAGSNALLHVLYHIKEDDRMIRTLLSHDSTGCAQRYFREGIEGIFAGMLSGSRCSEIQSNYCIDYLVAAFLNTTRWWLHKCDGLTPTEAISLYSDASRAALQMVGISPEHFRHPRRKEIL